MADRTRFDEGWSGALPWPPLPTPCLPLPVLRLLVPAAADGSENITDFVAAAPPRHPPATSGPKPAGCVRRAENHASAESPRGHPRPAPAGGAFPTVDPTPSAFWIARPSFRS